MVTDRETKKTGNKRYYSSSVGAEVAVAVVVVVAVVVIVIVLVVLVVVVGAQRKGRGGRI